MPPTPESGFTFLRATAQAPDQQASPRPPTPRAQDILVRPVVSGDTLIVGLIMKRAAPTGARASNSTLPIPERFAFHTQQRYLEPAAPS